MSALPNFANTHLGRAAAAHARDGELVLQVCTACERVQYPYREICAACLSGDLEWAPVAGYGTLLARVEVHASVEEYFRAHAPWPVCSVRLDAGPTVIAHVGPPGAHGRGDDRAIVTGDRVQVTQQTAGECSCVLVARRGQGPDQESRE